MNLHNPNIEECYKYIKIRFLIKKNLKPKKIYQALKKYLKIKILKVLKNFKK